jgi:hypothetical protein
MGIKKMIPPTMVVLMSFSMIQAFPSCDAMGVGDRPFL